MKQDKKVALCLHGYFDSLQDSSSKGVDGHQHLLDRVYSQCEPDVYIHSWQPEKAQEINDLYKPKGFYYQKQIDFSPLCRSRELDKLNAGPPFRRTPETVMSHFCSMQRAINLCYESGTDYDIVIKARFDIGRINRNPDATPVQCITFDPSLDMSTIKLADWDMFNQGPADMWFYGDMKVMSKFNFVFHQLSKEFFIGSDLHQWVQDQDELVYQDLSNSVAYLKWFLINNDLWEDKEPLECIFE